MPHLCIARVLRLGLRLDRLRPVAQEDLTVLMARLQTTQGIGELAVVEDMCKVDVIYAHLFVFVFFT